MKLGISYNVFSGLELLEDSIKSILDECYHVNIVYQEISNKGNEKPEIYTNIKELYDLGYIDSAHLFVPDLGRQPKDNETRKRNIGLEACKKAGCTHFISMDADEVYDIEQVRYAKKLIVDNGYESTACQMQTYYKTAEYRVTPPEDYYVPFIYKINDRRFLKGMRWPVLADPSRKMQPDKFYAFKRNELEMHHFSYVRTDIRDKLFNSSSSTNYGSRLEDIARHHDNWKYPEKAYLGGAKINLRQVEKCLNQFNIFV